MIYTQSAVKDLEREEACPFRWKSRWIDKNPALQISNEYTERGKFFEQLVLGSSAHENNPVIDLPRLLNGAKSLDQLRIERQAERTIQILNGNNSLGLKLTNSQIHLSDGDEEGTLDMEMHDTEGNPWIVDLKLTKDVSSTRSQYGYGNDWAEMDQLQLMHYGSKYEKKFGKKPRLALLVIDYSPKENIEFREIILSQDKMRERDIRFSNVREAVEFFNTTEWPKLPSKYECKECPLNCNFRYNELK